MEIRYRKPINTDGLSLKRVAAYARVSAEKEMADHSLVQQISYYNDYISKHAGWIFAGIYAEEGVSGTKDTRPEFVRLLNDCRTGKIDLVITKSITRFARNTVTLLDTIRELKELGVDVYFEKENMHSISPDGELMLTLLAMYAEEESRSASENKRWQIRRDFEQGKPTYCRPYGYRMVDHRLEIEPQEADVIRRIFSDYLSGKGTTLIAKELNADAVPSRFGKWRPSSVYYILRNPCYAGNLLLQKYHIPDFRSKKKVVNNGQWRQYLVEGAHEAIIDKAVFEQVQAEIEHRHSDYLYTNPATVHLFQGLIVCGCCKAHYNWTKAPTSTGRIPVWQCSTFQHMGKHYCQSKRIRESILIDKAREALELPEDAEITRELLLDRITAIESAADHQLRFFLKSGQVKILTWNNPSRKQSWTPEMKQKARERTLAQWKEAKHVDA